MTVLKKRFVGGKKYLLAIEKRKPYRNDTLNVTLILYTQGKDLVGNIVYVDYTNLQYARTKAEMKLLNTIYNLFK